MLHAQAPRLSINLSALSENYNICRRYFTGQECSAVVKADAYGLGAKDIAFELSQQGCQTFFVATLHEAVTLREALPHHKIAVLNGVAEGESMVMANHRLVPVLNSPEQLRRWQDVARHKSDCPAILHLDTGMARLGFTRAEFHALMQQDIEDAQIAMLMSHLACASEPEHQQNHEQLEQFISLVSRFPELPTSLCNSGGIFLGEAWHDDLARPGCALYGIEPAPNTLVGLQPVVTLSAPILQIRELDAEQPVGYGATQTLLKGTRLATVAIGYADGVFRGLSHKLYGFIGEYKVPLVGRVTMDLLTFNVTAVPETVMERTTEIEILNARQTVNDVAAMADTIGYEVLARLGSRTRRVYVGKGEAHE